MDHTLFMVTGCLSALFILCDARHRVRCPRFDDSPQKKTDENTSSTKRVRCVRKADPDWYTWDGSSNWDGSSDWDSWSYWEGFHNRNQVNNFHYFGVLPPLLFLIITIMLCHYAKKKKIWCFNINRSTVTTTQIRQTPERHAFQNWHGNVPHPGYPPPPPGQSYPPPPPGQSYPPPPPGQFYPPPPQPSYQADISGQGESSNLLPYYDTGPQPPQAQVDPFRPPAYEDGRDFPQSQRDVSLPSYEEVKHIKSRNMNLDEHTEPSASVPPAEDMQLPDTKMPL